MPIGRKRDLALDLLRGYLLVVIMIDHLRFAKNPLYVISGDQSLWVTAAEGFVLISGFLVGMLRGDEARLDPRGATRHLLVRAGTLALWSALLTIGFRTISELTGYWPAVPNADAGGTFLGYVWGAIDLRKTYGDANLLAAYSLFLLVAPLALLAMVRGHTAIVVGASVLLWALAFHYELAWSNSVQIDACWQLLFLIGMAAGFHRAAITERWEAWTPGRRRAIALAGGVASLGIVVGSLVRFPVRGLYRSTLEVHLFDRDRLGPGRIVCAVILITTLYGLVRRYEAKLVPTIGKVLVPLGQASLYVYIVQALLTFVLVNRALANPWIAAGTSLAMIALVFILVRNRFLFRVIPR